MSLSEWFLTFQAFRFSRRDLKHRPKNEKMKSKNNEKFILILRCQQSYLFKLSVESLSKISVDDHFMASNILYQANKLYFIDSNNTSLYDSLLKQIVTNHIHIYMHTHHKNIHTHARVGTLWFYSLFIGVWWRSAPFCIRFADSCQLDIIDV